MTCGRNKRARKNAGGRISGLCWRAQGSPRVGDAARPVVPGFQEPGELGSHPSDVCEGARQRVLARGWVCLGSPTSRACHRSWCTRRARRSPALIGHGYLAPHRTHGFRAWFVIGSAGTCPDRSACRRAGRAMRVKGGGPGRGAAPTRCPCAGCGSGRPRARPPPPRRAQEPRPGRTAVGSSSWAPASTGEQHLRQLDAPPLDARQERGQEARPQPCPRRGAPRRPRRCRRELGGVRRARLVWLRGVRERHEAWAPSRVRVPGRPHRGRPLADPAPASSAGSPEASESPEVVGANSVTARTRKSRETQRHLRRR